MNLSGEALRVLGSLVEKERTTPEYYPMSTNALVAACNQKSNRDPVLSLDEAAVDRALEELRGLGLAVRAAGGGRVVKHSHNLHGKLQVDAAEVSLLAELSLRGPQTTGELRGRAERMHRFTDLSEVDEALGRLAERSPPLVEKLPRQPGHKEARWRQLLGGGAPIEGAAAAGTERSPFTNTAPNPLDEDAQARIERLEAEVAELRAQVAELWRELRSLTMMPE